jgi:AraC family transcriptional regulator
MATIENYTLYQELRRESVPLAKSAHLGDGVAAALWNRHAKAITRYEDPNHHTLSLYVAGGDLIRWKNGGTWIANDGPGTLCVMPRNVTTEWAVDGWIHLFHLYVPRPAFDRAVLEALDADPDKVQLMERIYFHDPAVENMVRSCLFGFDWTDSADRIALGHVGRAMIATLVSRFTNRATHATRAVGGLSPAVGRRLVEFIDANLAAELAIDDLAREAGLSPFHFARAFKRTMGEGPHRFVSRRRIERAKQCLAAGMPPAAVAAACGFSSQSHFTQRFRDFTGTTPAAFARGCP